MTHRLAEVLEELLAGGADFGSLSVDRIIRGANIARSTFYIYFADKGELLGTVGGRAVSAVIEASRDWSAFPDDGTRDELREIFAGLVRTYRAHANILRAMDDAAPSAPTVRAELKRLVRIGTLELTRHVAAAQQRGAVRPDLDPAATVAWLVSMVERGLYQHTRDTTDPDRASDALAGIVWFTLYADTRAERALKVGP
ncbi:TetR/AcrR family transcriptional regulator [Pseudonocardia sp. NPDC049154]|uniref:TetR/AcrR family transcriptional regulator n=1 Tax=Pseudonocardia sp. NPDC049154 TaxID=3155501 RepID=UPI0033E0D597